MDKMDRMLQSLPRQDPSADLPLRILASIHRRHLRRRALRLTLASGIAMIGLWMIAPGAAWLVNSQPLSSAVPWLSGGTDYLSWQSVQLFAGLWNAMLSLQSRLGASLFASIWVGSLLLCIAMLFVLDIQVYPAPSNSM